MYVLCLHSYWERCVGDVCLTKHVCVAVVTGSAEKEIEEGQNPSPRVNEHDP